MKKILFILCAFIAVFCSCSKSTLVQSKNVEITIYSAKTVVFHETLTMLKSSNSFLATSLSAGKDPAGAGRQALMASYTESSSLFSIEYQMSYDSGGLTTIKSTFEIVSGKGTATIEGSDYNKDKNQYMVSVSM